MNAGLPYTLLSLYGVACLGHDIRLNAVVVFGAAHPWPSPSPNGGDGEGIIGMSYKECFAYSL